MSHVTWLVDADVDAPIMSLTSDDVAVDQSLIVVDNSTSTLSCNVDAYPPVDASAVVWYKDAAFAGLLIFRFIW